MAESKGKPMLDLLISTFIELYQMKYGFSPSDIEIKKYLNFLIGEDQKLILKYDVNTIKEKTINYFLGRI